MRGFSETQKSELFELAKNAKSSGMTLCEVFESVAKKYGKAVGSVRNYYYKCVGEGKAEGLKAKTLKPFSQEEERELISRVLAERKNCGSLRKALLKVANGDKVLAMRYQNKFANLLKKQRIKVMREVILQRKKFGKAFNPYSFKNECEKRNKLKCEIEELIDAINRKCGAENELLKKKLLELEKLTPDFYDFNADENLVSNYFSKIKDKKSN